MNDLMGETLRSAADAVAECVAPPSLASLRHRARRRRARAVGTGAAALLAVATAAVVSVTGLGVGRQTLVPAGPPTGSSQGPTAPDAVDVIYVLKEAGLPIAPWRWFQVTAAEDPQHRYLFGQPHAYTSKVLFEDVRVPAKYRMGESPDVRSGGSIEVFANAADAALRVRWLASHHVPSEYDFLHGRILLRVTGTLTRAEALRYKAALDSL